MTILLLESYMQLGTARSDVLGQSRSRRSNSRTGVNKMVRADRCRTGSLFLASEEAVLHNEFIDLEVAGFNWVREKRLKVEQKVFFKSLPATSREPANH